MIRKRLCVEGEGGSDDRRVLSLLKTFVRWVSGPALSEEEREATYQKMLFTLGTRWAWSIACVTCGVCSIYTVWRIPHRPVRVLLHQDTARDGHEQT